MYHVYEVSRCVGGQLREYSWWTWSGKIFFVIENDFLRLKSEHIRAFICIAQSPQSVYRLNLGLALRVSYARCPRPSHLIKYLTFKQESKRII